MVPEPSPRRSRWSRILDRFTGSADGEHDDRTAVPAVDPWAGQDTPVWAEAYTTSPAGVTATTVQAPPTRFDNPTAVDRPAASGASARAGGTPSPAGSPAPPAGLPPRLREWSERASTEAPERLRAWGRQAAANSRQAAAKGQEVAANAPGKLRSWRRQAAARLPRRQQAAPRGPVQPHTPLGQTRPPATPPWTARPTPPRPRRRLRRLRRLVLLLVVLAALVAGRPYIQEHVPVLNQYPVTAVLPDSFADLSLRDTAAGEKAARRLAEQLQEAGADGDGFAGVYTDARGKRVTVFGVTGLRLTPGSDLDGQLSRLSESLGLTNVQAYDVGEFGAHQQCGTGRLDGTSVVACGWADHGSLATVLLTRRSLDESAGLVTRLRDTVLAPA